MYQERMVTIAEMAENARFFFESRCTTPSGGKACENNGGAEFLRAALEILGW